MLAGITMNSLAEHGVLALLQSMTNEMPVHWLVPHVNSHPMLKCRQLSPDIMPTGRRAPRESRSQVTQHSAASRDMHTANELGGN